MPKDKDDDGDKKDTAAGSTDLNAGGNQMDTAQASSTMGAQVPGIISFDLGNIQDAIHHVKSEILKILIELNEKITQIVNEIESKVKPIQKKATDTIMNSIDDLNEKLHQISHTGKISWNCVRKHLEQIDDITEYAELKLENCQATTTENIREIPEYVKEHVDGIQEKLDSIDALFDVCGEITENRAQLAACVTKQIAEIHMEVFRILTHAILAIFKASKRAIFIVAGAEKCYAKTVTHVQEQIYELIESITKCIVDGGV